MKKTLSILLIAFIGITMFGCSTDSDVWKNNTGTIDLDTMTVTGNGISVSDNTINITSGGDFTVTGTLSDGMIYVKTDSKVKLRLSGMSITNPSGPAIFFDNAEEGLITITENTENFLADGSEYTTEEAAAVIFSNDDLEIKGTGKLTINASYKHGIAGDDDVKIENGNISINSYEHGIKVNDTLSYSNASISIVSETGKGMKAEKEVIIDSGTINITSGDEGIESKGPLTINGGDINIISAEDGINTGSSSITTDTSADAAVQPDGQMPQGERPTMPEDEMPIPPEGMENMTPPDGGHMPMRGGRGKRPEGTPPPMPEGAPSMGEMPGGGRGAMMGGGINRIDKETAAAHAITINGGNIYINAKGDGIDSNGSLTINGGRIVIDGPVSNGNGSLDSEGAFILSGGEVVTTSSMGMMQLPQAKSTNTLRVTFDKTQNAQTKLSVKSNEDGEEIVSVTPENQYQLFVFISDKLVTGKEYSIYTGDTLYQSFTVTESSTFVGSDGFGFGGRGGKSRNMKTDL